MQAIILDVCQTVIFWANVGQAGKNRENWQ